MPDTFDVPLTTAAINTNARSRSIYDLDPGLSRTMGAAFDDAMIHNPVSAVNRMVAQSVYGKYTEGHTGIGSDLQKVEPSVMHSRLREMQIESNKNIDDFLKRIDQNQYWNSAETTQAIIEANGFTSSDIPTSAGGTNVFALDAVIRGKIAERERENILQRGSQGRMIPVLAAGLGASILDPINLAASFIPVVGQAKYASLLRNTSSTAGRFAVRAGVGAAEGAVGAAAVEPLMLMASNQDLLHYGIEDSMMNVLFGAAIGGGMHMGIGYMGDRIRLRNGLGLDPEPHGKTAQALNEVDPLLRQKAMESAIMAAVRDRGMVVDELINGVNGPLHVGEKFDLPQAIKFDVDDTGAIVPRDTIDLDELMNDIIQDVDTAPEVRRIIKSADTPEQAIQTLSRLLERQKTLARKNVDDIKNILGSAATDQDVKNFSDALQSKFKQFDEEITGVASRQPAAAEFNLKNYSDIFEAPNNMNTYDEAHLAEINEIRERVPVELDDTFLETQINDSELIVKQFEDVTGIEDATFRAESDNIKKLSQERGRMTNNLLNCMLGAS